MYRIPGAGGAAAGGLALTGVGVAWWLALAIVLLVAGLLLLHAARRRRIASAE
jgi:predicted MFS family arabinose efflux permease